MTILALLIMLLVYVGVVVIMKLWFSRGDKK